MLDTLLAACTHSPITGAYGPVAGLFLAGLAGSVAHCSAMCGPLALSQCGAARASSDSWKLHGAYHLGRMTTYIGLGIGASLLSRQIMALSGYQFISSLLLALAGAMFLAACLSRTNLKLPLQSCGFPRWLQSISAPLFSASLPSRRFLLGLMLGFIPCGLLYAALMLAAATANPLTAGLGMAAFALGTMPLLGLIAAAGERGLPKLPAYARTLLLATNSAMLFAMAGANLA